VFDWDEPRTAGPGGSWMGTSRGAAWTGFTTALATTCRSCWPGGAPRAHRCRRPHRSRMRPHRRARMP